MFGKAVNAARLSVLLLRAGMGALALGLALGSTGLVWPGAGSAVGDTVLWQIRLPRSLAAWLAGALLGLAGAIAQGLFRNPLADPFLLGSASGAALGVALALVAMGSTAASVLWLANLGLTGGAFVGALLGVGLTIALARGTAHTLRLLLGGVVVGVVLGAVTSLVGNRNPQILSAMQGFNLGTTAFVSLSSCATMAAVLLPSTVLAFSWAKGLDALALGQDTALSLGLPLARINTAMVLLLALCTGTSVAQTGLIAFVGLAAPHMVRALGIANHRSLLVLSALAGGLLLCLADALARAATAPEELPVGVVTAVVGGGYLMLRLHKK